MYPTIYHVFFDWFGWEIPFLKLLNSFGFFVAMAFIVGSWILTAEMKRKDRDGLLPKEKRKVIMGKPVQWSEVITNGVIGFILGWKILWLMWNSGELFTPDKRPQEFIFSMDGYWIMGILLAVILAGWRYYDYSSKALPNPEEKVVIFHQYEYVGSITMVAALFGIVGAKFFHLFENPDEFLVFFKQPTLDNFLSGLTIFGGLIVAGIALGIYAWRKGIPILHLLDSLAPAYVMAYGIGRIGCQVSGDGDWGINNTMAKPEILAWLPDKLWAYTYPNNVNGVGMKIPADSGIDIYQGYGTQLSVPVFPTPVYETAAMLLVFLFVWQIRKRMEIPGLMLAICLFFVGVERFFIEKIRVNNVFEFLGMQVTQAEVISTILIVAGTAMAVVFWRLHPRIFNYRKWA